MRTHTSSFFFVLFSNCCRLSPPDFSGAPIPTSRRSNQRASVCVLVIYTLSLYPFLPTANLQWPSPHLFNPAATLLSLFDFNGAHERTWLGSKEKNGPKNKVAVGEFTGFIRGGSRTLSRTPLGRNRSPPGATPPSSTRSIDQAWRRTDPKRVGKKTINTGVRSVSRKSKNIICFENQIRW